MPGPSQPVKEEDDNGKDGVDDSSDDNDNQAGAEQEGTVNLLEPRHDRTCFREFPTR